MSDYIGCMSQENVDYILLHNSEISADKVEICPNSIDIHNIYLSDQERIAVRNRYVSTRLKSFCLRGESWRTTRSSVHY